MAQHRFIVVIPVADRPQHLRACLDSLLELQRRYPYGGVSVLIADDSDDPGHVADNAALAAHYAQQGIPTLHFSPDEQADLVDRLAGDRQAAVRIVGDAPRRHFGHKGQGAMRNIAYLKLARMLRDAPDRDKVLIWSIDSDQEFKVKVASGQVDEEVYGVDFFGSLDAIFSRTDALVLTGKVVGDPPVSPAVMTDNFLDDVIGFLGETSCHSAAAVCAHHETTRRQQGEAAYHDMADLFGFARAGAYSYRCPLPGVHAEADCFAHFASRLAGFFHGEHPTRVSYYLAGDPLASLQAARTVYAGNYVFRPAALEYFLPFADLRLRMSGPTLGRLVRAQIGQRFISANLPMLHKRTVAGTAQAEFRPGIEIRQDETRRAAPSVSSPPGGRSPRSGDFAGGLIDMGGEFERQFYGDVMLFAIDRLTALGYPQQPIDTGIVAETIDVVRCEMLDRYNARHNAIRARLAQAEALLRDPGYWWNLSSAHTAAVDNFAAFFANVAGNFAADSRVCLCINDQQSWGRWRDKLIDAVDRYPGDCQTWRRILAGSQG